MEKLTHECFEAECTPLPGLSLACHAIERDLIEITAEAHLPEETPVGDWQLNVRPCFVPDFFYTPHLTPGEGYAVDQHVFRTPALMMGRVLRFPFTSHIQCRQVRIQSADMRLNVDGEVFGVDEAVFSVAPGRLCLYW